MAEFSNKTLIGIVLLSLAVTLLGIWELYDKLQTTGLVANPTGTVSANVQSTVDIFLQNNTVNFGNVGVGATYVTNGNWSNASQFLLRNDGSVEVNVTVISTYLFNSTCTPANNNYRFNATNVTGNTTLPVNCPAGAGSDQNTWYQMPLSALAPPCTGSGISADLFACRMNFSDGNDYVRMDIQITVPTGEGAGAKTSTVTFTASQA